MKFYFTIVLIHFIIFYFPSLIYYTDFGDPHYSIVTINDNGIDIDYFIQSSVMLVAIPNWINKHCFIYVY